MANGVRKSIEDAVADPSVAKIYANSFFCALGLGDVAVMLLNGNQPVAVVNLSFSMAKTLAIKVQQLIGLLEAKSGNQIMTSDEIGKYLSTEPGKDEQSLQ